MRVFFFMLFVSFGISVLAQEPPAPLGFQEWKDEQILDAQNQVLRSSARLAQQRAGKVTSPKKAARLPNDKVRAAAEDESLAAERDLKRAQDYLTNANKLSFTNYIEVYIPTLKDNPVALQRLGEKLSKDELALIFKAIMNGDAGDVRHSLTVAK